MSVWSRIWEGDEAREERPVTMRPMAWWPVAVVATTLSVVLGQMSVALSAPGTSYATWWPAAGVTVALFLLAPRRLWPVALALVWLATCASNLLIDRPLPLSLWYSVGTLAEAVVATAVLTDWFRRTAQLRSVADVGRLLIAAAAGSVSLAVVGATGVAMVMGQHFSTAFWSLAISHMAAHLVVLPLMLLAFPHHAGDGAYAERVHGWEAPVQVALVLGAAALCYLDPAGRPTQLLILPFLVWGALRLGTTVVVSELFVISWLMVLSATQGLGPFSRWVGAEQRLMVQLSLLALSAVTVTVVVAANQRRRALRHARAARDDLRDVLDSARGVAILAVDLQGDVVVWSAGAERKLGYSADEAVGMNLVQLRRDDLATLPGSGLAVETWDRLRAGEKLVEVDRTCVRKDGTEFIGRVRISARTDDHGVIVGALGVVEDVTAQRIAERALRAALAHERDSVLRLQEMDAAKSTFVAEVSHELRTPLTSIVGYAQMAMENPESGPGNRVLMERVLRNARRLETLAEDLITASRMDGGTYGFHPRPHDLRDTVSTAVADMALRLGERTVDLRFEADADCVPVYGDPVQLERVVANLVANAVKFTPDGGIITVRVGRTEDASVVEVIDNGCGIDAEDLTAIFDRFFRTASARRDAVEGTGLGLFLVKEIVAVHGGRVMVDSTVGTGAHFTVTLPARGTADYGPASTSARLPSGGDSTHAC